MEEELKRIIFKRVLIMTIILYVIGLTIYFVGYYEPFQPIYGEYNERFKSSRRESMILSFIVGLNVCFAASLVLSLIYDEILLYIKPVITVSARVISKDYFYGMDGNPRNTPNVTSKYKLTFELENGIELKLPVTPYEYMMYFEANKGVLKYKEASLKRFISFELKEIEQ
jgi:heme/copper-type cytochrome/quinol oxidase subunit 2